MGDDSGVPDRETAEDGFWRQAGPVERKFRVRGWKLHVSATALSAPEILFRAARVLVRRRCPFKFSARAEHVEELTDTRYDRAQCGNFITAYPRDDDEFRTLAGELDRATAGLPGPRIPSDRPYRTGSLVHYRDGVFRGVPHLTNEGVHQARLRAPDGSGTGVTVDYGVGPAGAVPVLLRMREGGPRPLLDDAGEPAQATAFEGVPA
ncbi:hypothetical protein ACIQVK_32180 [Streptomyces sp. NPDC090493]|uniref:class III lanthionine synthetase LanKC N-terminal domain-containing protein n=1 Tax=Streptomyces sp. NPDC090493 TaxID=3365964 RepID=UPI0038242317